MTVRELVAKLIELDMNKEVLMEHSGVNQLRIDGVTQTLNSVVLESYGE